MHVPAAKPWDGRPLTGTSINRQGGLGLLEPWKCHPRLRWPVVLLRFFARVETSDHKKSLEESGFRDAEVACPMACRAVLACLKVMGAGVHHMPLAMRAPCTSGHAGSNATKPRSRTWKSLASGTL